jgi:hypothetical protein
MGTYNAFLDLTPGSEVRRFGGLAERRGWVRFSSAAALSQHYSRFQSRFVFCISPAAERDLSGLLRQLIGEEPGPQLHNPVLLIGNDRTGVWEDAEGLSSPDKLIEIIDRVSAAGSRAHPDQR